MLSRRKYLEILKATTEETLKVMGYDFDRDILAQCKLEIGNDDSHLSTSPRGMVGLQNYHRLEGGERK